MLFFSLTLVHVEGTAIKIVPCSIVDGPIQRHNPLTRNSSLKKGHPLVFDLPVDIDSVKRRWDYKPPELGTVIKTDHLDVDGSFEDCPHVLVD
ncbi:hypothetical protein PDE_09450 [Penicillium oxalicum 114-2]|uniref:Uncharacterized protein n=1 Tax=Penicillium oxalicum (strain 114-2 / CGMCC 5302) TaxID=933388 RepID=S8A060_PENO1|nr:hypothetical protein PDE_09450 [Penicillium oxalicum 114-2]